jgi:hypothetical protein
MAFVAGTNSTLTGNSPQTTASVDMATGGATCLVVAIAAPTGTTATDGSITDSSGNTYVPLGDWAKYTAASGARIRAWICTNPTVTTTMTATGTWGGGGTGQVIFAGFSGRSAFPIADIYIGKAEASTFTSHSITTVVPSILGVDLLAISALLTGAAISPASTGSWTVIGSQSNLVFSQRQANADNISITNTFTTGTARQYADLIIGVLPAGYLGHSVGINWDSR